MPKFIHLDHHDTAHYIPMYQRTGGFTGHEREVYKLLVSRIIHEGRVIDSTFLDDQPNLRSTFAAIGFDYLLNIEERFIPSLCFNITKVSLGFLKFFVKEFVCTPPIGPYHPFKMLHPWIHQIQGTNPRNGRCVSRMDQLFRTDLNFKGFSSKNYVRKFLRALHPKWRAKVTTIEESKDLSSLALDELISNLKVHEVVMKKDSEIYRGRKERIKSITLAKKESSDDETSASKSDDEEYAIAIRNL
nr:UBN2 domain-containing protein [Tanacetum cinerariifolium]